ncbi:uncharacterized protein CC84DRAFT_1087410, partial [Paraphaeosphaeria sporulosa]
NAVETGVMLSMLGSVKVLLGKNDMITYIGARVRREVVIAVECYALSESGYTGSCLSLLWLKRILDPETQERAKHKSGALKPQVLICNGFSTHKTLEILEFCLSNNIILCQLQKPTG